MTSPRRDLTGRVALVAGATRGAGRGIATALGERGATVICTGRTTRQCRSELDRPETIEETAERVTAAGGTGIALRCDHALPAVVVPDAGSISSSTTSGAGRRSSSSACPCGSSTSRRPGRCSTPDCGPTS